MGRKNNSSGATNTTCSKCGVTAHSTPKTLHRRCGGQQDASIRAKSEKLPSEARGTWQ